MIFGLVSRRAVCTSRYLRASAPARDPNYASTGYLYVLYTAPGPDGGPDYTAHPETGVRTVLARFQVGGGANEGTVLLSVDQPGRYHNGGQLAFGPENYLYVSIGDGGTGVDPAQQTGDLLGSILRIVPDGGSADRPYAVPSGNPFADYVSGRVWALSRSGGTVTGHRLLAQHERPGSLAGHLVEITRMPDGRLFFAALHGSIYRLARR